MDFGQARSTMTKATSQARRGVDILEEITLSKERVYGIKHRTWDQRKCSLFMTAERCAPKTNRVISPMVKYRENGTGNKCSL